MSKPKIQPKLQQMSDPTVAHKFAYDEVIAVKALSRGEASPEQQKKILNLVYEITQTKFQDVYPNNEAFTNWAGGKRSIGQQFVWAEFMGLEDFEKIKQPKKDK